VTTNILVYGGAGVVVGLIIGSMLRDDGKMQGLGAPLRKPSSAAIRQAQAIATAQTRAAVSRVLPSRQQAVAAQMQSLRQAEAIRRAKQAIASQYLDQNAMMVLAQRLTEYENAEVFPGFNLDHPRFAATLQGTR
jgi:hypothetical protein